MVPRSRTTPPQYRSGGAGAGPSGEEREAELYELAKLVLDDLPVADIAREVSEVASRLLGTDFACVMQLTPDGESLVLQSGVGFDASLPADFRVAVGNKARLGYVSQAMYTMFSDEPVVVPNLTTERHFEGCELLKHHAVKSGITVRVESRDGCHYGLVGAYWSEPREMNSWEAAWLREAAHTLGRAHSRDASASDSTAAELAAENARRECRLARRRHENLRDAMAYVAASQDPLAALEAAASLAVHHGADWCFVDLKEESADPGYTTGGTIRRVVVRHAGRDPRSLRLAQALANNYPMDPMAPHGTPRVLWQQRSHLITDVSREHMEGSANDPGHLALLEEIGPTSLAAAPLLAAGKTAGAMVAVTTDGSRLCDDQLAILEELAWCASLALRSDVAGLSAERGQARMADLARSDPSVGTAAETNEPAGPTQADVGGPTATAGARPALTNRLREVLALRAQGLSREEIASELSIEESTVKTHLASICTKLGVKGSRAAVARAREIGELPYP